MKKFTLFLIAIIATGVMQQSHSQVLGACGKNKNPVPNDGSGSLGQSFNQTSCGLNYVQASALIETRFNAYTTAGNYGSGLPTTLTINGLPASNTILKAYVWYFTSYTEAAAPSTSVTITNPANDTTSADSILTIGTSVSKCWGETGTAVYRADVTPAISGNGNYILNISGFSNPSWEVDGATLFIIYKDQSATYQGSLVIWDGAMATSSGGTLSQTDTGFSVCSTPSSARAFAISSDHQDNIALTHPTTLNGVASNFPNSMYNFDEAPVTLTGGQTTISFAESDGGFGDCFLWGVMGLYYQTTDCANCAAGVNELNNQINFSVSPNPTNGVFNVQMSKFENVQIKIYNVLGECVYQHIGISANQQIDLSDTPNGVYFLQLKTNDGIAVKKLIKEQ